MNFQRILNKIQEQWVSTIETQCELRCALFCKAGSGKTAVILEVMKRNPMQWVLFLRRSHFNTWKTEIAKWTNWVKTGEDSWNMLDGSQVLLRSMDAEKQITFLKGYQQYGLVIDESYNVKGRTSHRHKSLRHICDNAKAVIIANADPVVASVYDLWGQMRLVVGPAIGNSLSLRKRYFARDINGFGFHELPEAAEKFKEHPFVKQHSIWYHPPSEKEVLHKIVKVEMHASQKRHYDSILSDMQTTVNDKTIIYTYAMEKAIRLHQICGGAFPFIQDGKPKLGYLNCNKLTWLLDFVKYITTEQVVVWCAYRHEVKRIANYLESWGVECGSYMGGESGGEFSIPEMKVVAATLDMGISTNLFSQFPIAIYYSENYKYYLRSQSRYRTDRVDSKHKVVTYYYLQCKDSVDEYIYKMIRQRGMTARKLFNPKNLCSQLQSTASKNS